MRKHESKWVTALHGLYQNRETNQLVTAVAINSQGLIYTVVYRDMVRVGRYLFSEGLHAMEQQEFHKDFTRVWL